MVSSRRCSPCWHGSFGSKSGQRSMKWWDERMWTYRSFFIFRKIYRYSASKSVSTNQRRSLSCAVSQSFEKWFDFSKSSKNLLTPWSSIQGILSSLHVFGLVTAYTGVFLHYVIPAPPLLHLDTWNQIWLGTDFPVHLLSIYILQCSLVISI